MPDQSYAATEHALLEEITRPLERLPEDPLELVEADFPTAMRGYDKAAVDEYVHETRRLVAELQSVRTPEAAVRRALVRAGGMISGVLRRAHETAAEITAQSRSEAEDRLEQARAEADEMMDAAEQRVRDLDADTDRIWLDRQRIMADVEDLSNQLLGLAKEAGERFSDSDGEDPDAYGAAAGTSLDDTPRADAHRGDSSEADPEPAGSAPLTSADPEPGPREPAVWERWADHDAGAADPSGDTRLTDRDETLPLATPSTPDAAGPPEVEPRSARLSPEDPAEAGPGGAESGSAGMIPPMSEAANRSRRT